MSSIGLTRAARASTDRARKMVGSAAIRRRSWDRSGCAATRCVTGAASTDMEAAACAFWIGLAFVAGAFLGVVGVALMLMARRNE